MGKDPWYECSDPKHHLLEGYRDRCIAPCKSEDFQRLMLTPKEALDRVGPNRDRLWFYSSERIIAVSEEIERIYSQGKLELKAALAN